MKTDRNNFQSPSAVRHRRFTRLAGVLSLTVALVGLMAAPASATDNTAGQYIIDRDNVEIVGQSAAVFGGGIHQVNDYSDSGKLVWYHDASTQRIRAQLTGRIFVSQDGCGFMRATWTYGDGSTSVSSSGLACDNGEAVVDLDSVPTRDALKVKVELRAGGQFQSQDAMINFGTRSERVMEGSDSDGTCAKVDLDLFTIANGAGPLFQGRATFFCAGADIRVRVQGTLTWNDTIAGDRAKFTAWFGGLNIVDSGLVSQAHPTTTVDITSPVGRDTLKVRTRVFSAPNGSSTFTSQGAVDLELGKV